MRVRDFAARCGEVLIDDLAVFVQQLERDLTLRSRGRDCQARFHVFRDAQRRTTNWYALNSPDFGSDRCLRLSRRGRHNSLSCRGSGCGRFLAAPIVSRLDHDGGDPNWLTAFCRCGLNSGRNGSGFSYNVAVAKQLIEERPPVIIHGRPVTLELPKKLADVIRVDAELVCDQFVNLRLTYFPRCHSVSTSILSLMGEADADNRTGPAGP